MSEEVSKTKETEYEEELITSVIRRLRVCQIPGLRLMGLVPKGKENDDTTVLEEVMGVSIKMTQLGAMPVIVSMDFCATPIKTYRVHMLSGEYRASELSEEDARTYAKLFLDACADLLRQKDQADLPAHQVMQAPPGAMAMLEQLARGGHTRGPGGGIISGR